MFNASYKITSIWGIPVKVHVSLIVLIILMVQDFGWIFGLLVSLGLLVSIVLHELGHSIVAIRKGCRVREITLMFMGGAAQMDRIPTRPRDEFLMALAGPAVSLLLGVICIFTGMHLNLPQVNGIPLNIIELIGGINIGLVIFNLLPAFPMDGGRILRAALTPRFGRLKATLHAARFGKIMAVIMGVTGLFPQIIGLNSTINPIQIFIAIMIYILAGQEYRLVQMQEAAKSYSFGGMWPPFEAPWRPDNPDESEDKVIISPPPYKDGPESESNLRPFTRKNPFSDLFGQ